MASATSAACSACSALEHAIAVLLQDVGHECTNALVVFDDQHRFRCRPTTAGPGVRAKAGRRHAPPAGNRMRNVVPFPARCRRRSSPPLCCTMPYTVASPSPVPWPWLLVVKNGSKMCERGLRIHAAPVSLTASCTYTAAAVDAATFEQSRYRIWPSARHGVAGVDRQIHQHLLDLPGVGAHEPEPRFAAHTSSMSSPITRRSIFSVLARDCVRGRALRGAASACG